MAGHIQEQAFALLRATPALEMTEVMLQRLQVYLSLVRKWNDTFNLVSAGDVPYLEEKHLVDALSLVPYIVNHAGQTCQALDIGTGGGFPMVPIKCVLPDMRCMLIERNARKIGFLHRVVAALDLSGVEVVHGAFPEALGKITAQVVTARAVEQPRRLLPAIVNRLPADCLFLCQTDPSVAHIPATFHVEHVNDDWTRLGLRRGELHLITSKQTLGD